MGISTGPRGGLDRRVTQSINSIDIVHDQKQWDQLAETAQIIGECRGLVPTVHNGRDVSVPCDGVLFALPTPDYQQPTDAVWWQEAQCGSCRYTMAIPNRRKLVQSTRHGEMPHNYWTDREKRLRPTQADT